MNNSNPLQYILRFFQRLNTYLAYIGAFALFFMMCLTMVDVIGRTLFNSPVIGAFELTEFLVLILIFSFLGYTQTHKSHIHVELFTMFFSKKIKDFIELFNHIACLVIMILITWMGFEKAVEILEAGETSPNLYLPNYPFVFFLVLGCAVMCIEYIKDISNSIKKRRGAGK